jgi:uncharacterized protein YndB with AHSA1/START domain
MGMLARRRRIYIGNFPQSRAAKPALGHRIARPMGPVSAEIEIDVPRERAFDAIADLSRRASFTEHFLADFRLTRIEARGVGAGARFRFDVWPRRVWADTVIGELDRPHRIVEHGRGGRANRIPSTTLWELTEGPGSLTTVRVSYWTEPRGVDRALELLSGASIPYTRRWREALRRLRDQLESAAPGGERLAVAGGNPHATGIP